MFGAILGGLAGLAGLFGGGGAATALGTLSKVAGLVGGIAGGSGGSQQGGVFDPGPVQLPKFNLDPVKLAPMFESRYMDLPQVGANLNFQPEITNYLKMAPTDAFGERLQNQAFGLRSGQSRGFY